MKKNIKKLTFVVAVVAVLAVGVITVCSGGGGVEPGVGTFITLLK
jgi:hypothetical protein